jgi:hypothetical protein
MQLSSVRYNNYSQIQSSQISVNKEVAKSQNNVSKTRTNQDTVEISSAAIRAANNSVTVEVNGRRLSLSERAYINENGRAMVPLGDIARALGWDVSWSSRTQTATLTNDGDKIDVRIGRDYVLKNGERIYLSDEVELKNGKTMITSRFFEKAMNAEVKWNNNTRTVSITTKEQEDEGRELAKELIDVVTDFIPVVGTVKDAYNLYKVLKNPDSSAGEVATAILGFVPGLGDLKKISKLKDAIADVYRISSKQSRKLDRAAERILAERISKINAGKLLDFSEGRKVGGKVGHTLQKHVGLTDNELIRRAIKENTDVTSYTNKSTPINTIQKSLRQHSDEIAEWLLGDSSDIFAIRYDSDYSLGKGVYKGKTTVEKNVNMAITILMRDRNAPEGFSILTSYPALRWRD